MKLSKKGPNVAKHAWTQGHIIDFANAKVIDKGNYKNLKTLESWHTAITDEADNNPNTLPAHAYTFKKGTQETLIIYSYSPFVT